MDKVLDLRFKGQIDPKLNPLFNKIANDVRSGFIDLVTKISEPNRDCIDWWVEGPASRNTLISPFFHYYCAFHLVDELFRKNYDISEIIVESLALEKILKQYFRVNGKSIQIKYKGKRLKSHFKQFIIPFVKIPLELFRHIYQCLCAKKTKHLQRPIPDKNLTLIDVFVFPGYISKDRYYNGLWDNLNSKERETTFFVPALVNIPRSKILSAYEELRAADKNFMIKEDYLTMWDLLFAIFHYFRLFKIKRSQAIVLGIDISSLVSEELRSMRGYTGAVEALLNYCFVKRIKQRKINVRLIVNWFENQVVDKGWNAGFRKFYPESQIAGYRGFGNIPLWLNLYPSKIENDSMVIPTKIAVMGKGLVESTKEFFPELDVIRSPAFRFNHLFDETLHKSDSNKYIIFVALSIMIKESIYILKTVERIINNIDMNNLHFWVKPHPTMSEEILKKGLDGKWPKSFDFIDFSTQAALRKADILVGGMSNICLEAMALGVPVLVIEQPQGLQYNPIPDDIEQDLWKQCDSSQNILDGIEHYRKRDEKELARHHQLGLQIRETYFQPVTREGVLKFLGIEGDSTFAKS